MIRQNPKSKIQNPNKVGSIYLHIPFCKRKCNYCDFVSYAGKEELIDSYVEALCKEIQSSHLSFDYRRNSFPSPSNLACRQAGMERGGTNEVSDGVRTVFFGGGTPTLLDAKHFDKIINELVTRYALRVTNTEFSIEANPGTADKAKLKALRSLGINRLSIGVQSFHDHHLSRLGRIHNAAEAQCFYDNARAAGFENVNLDLIFGLPNQTLAEWKKDLNIAIALQPDHLSAYNLQIEEGTPFHSELPPAGRHGRTSNSQLPSEDEELAMYQHAIELLWLSGYQHYEISNFARPGYECRHNLTYWKNENYLGIGAGAHSHFNGQRWSNPNCIEEYLKNAPRRTPNETRLAPDQRETLFLGLRLLDGLAKEKFAGFDQEVAELIADKMLTESKGNYKLTRKGLYLANQVFAKFV